MMRPNDPDLLPEDTKNIRLGIYRTQIWPRDHAVCSHIRSHDLTLQDIRTVYMTFDWLFANLGMVMNKMLQHS